MVLPNFKENLEKYAQLIVEVGVNVQKSHTVIVQISVDQAPLARLITQKAYEKGADEVIVKWTDDFVQREFLSFASEDRLTTIPQYKIDESNDWIEKGASRISVVSSDPGSLAGVDSQRVATYQKASGKAMHAMRQATQANKVSWTVVAAAGPKWAEKVFSNLPQEDAQDLLWDQIFKTTRIYADDPIKAWREHDQTLQEKADKLNHSQFDALHYQAPGTDLTIGLPKNHLWAGAG